MTARAGAIDIGTNTVLLLVAERGADGVVRAIDERAEITRLGEGVDRTRTLSPEAIARTTACLDRYAEVLRSHQVESVGVVGTSAMRDAGGGEAVRAHVLDVLGVEARTISGDEEARLTFRGALSGLAIDPAKDVLVWDIGGGSTEVVVGSRSRGVSFARSFDVGSVRLTERHVRTDPPSAAERAAVSRAAAETFGALPALAYEGDPVGIAGTMTTLAAVALELERYDGARVHGHRMSKRELAEVVAELGALSLDERRNVRGMEPKRADVIVAGGELALAFLDRVGASGCVISDRGVRWGLAEELLSS